MFAVFRRSLTAVPARRSLNAESLSAALDERQREAFEVVCELVRKTGTEAYLVGGPVRDALMGAPVLDLDFSVVGDAPGLAGLLAERAGGRVTAHARFGTATVYASTIRMDLVTARRENYRQPGALPQVEPGSIGDDLARRDFTINAMALPLWPADAGVLDPQGGLDDLVAGIVRFLHPLSFVDDPTRMMRAVRYERRFGFRMERETLNGMSQAVSAGYMDAVSGDRWRNELERILEEADPVAPLMRAAGLGLLAGLHPALGKAEKNGEAGLQRIKALREDKGDIERDHCWAALFGPLTVLEAEGVIQRLNVGGRRAALARDTIGLRDSERQILRSAEYSSELARMLDCRVLNAVMAWAELTSDAGVAEALSRYTRELRFVRPELSGADLMAMGAAEGPELGKILDSLRDGRLDGKLRNAEEERALARELLARALVESAK